ncbi:MAG TPA: hypothetical protein VKU60_15645 [Chloroflexota bacterium]|nr:hypothetical protein [Chloroflexota bacterium]
MAGKGAEYRASGLHFGHKNNRSLHIDADGLRYEGPEQQVQLRWSEVQALIPAGVQVTTSDGDQDTIPSLGIVLHVPFAQPTLVDEALPNLDYAIPLGDLSKPPFLGISISPADIVATAADYARPAGVTLMETIPSA